MKRISLILILALLTSAGVYVAQAPTPAPSVLTSASETTAVSAAVTDTSATTLLAAPGAGLRWYITKAQCLNVSASTQSSAIVKTGSTSIWQVACTPGSIQNVVVFNPPLRQADANTALTMTATASVTSNYYIMAGFKGR